MAQGFGSITTRHRAAQLPQHLYSEPVGSIEVDQLERRLDAAPAIVTRTDSVAVRGAYVAVLLVLALFMVGAWDYAAAIEAEADEKNERAARIEASREQTLPLSHPLPYSISITQSGDGSPTPRTHYLFGHRAGR